MNIIAIIILVTIFAELILNLISDFLNLRMLQIELPETFRGWYDADRYIKSQEYLKVTTRFGWVVSSFGFPL